MRRAARAAVLGLMASGLLSLTAIGRAASPAVSPTLSPPDGQTAVTHGDTLYFGGIAEPGSEVENAELRFLDAARQPVREPLDATGQITLEGEGITGQYTLPSLCPAAETAEDCRERLNDGSVVLALTVRQNGEQATGTSNAVPVDMAAPYILKASLVAPKSIEVQFSEAVRLVGGEDESALDWTIAGSCQRGRPAIDIDGQGTTRTLTLLLDEDEDATPLVNYCPLPQRPAYKDRANRTVLTSSRTLIALDRVAPKIPTISGMAGRVGRHITANDPSPVVQLGGLRPGHFGQVYLETNPNPENPNLVEFDRSQDTLLGEAQANASGTAEVQVLQDLGADGTYLLWGVARDRAACTSEGTEVCPNYSGGDLGEYTLDTVVPLPLFAATDGPEVLVQFSEEVSGTDDPTQWAVEGAATTAVSGAGEQRVLSVTPDALAGADVVWTAPATGAYADAAGNQVAGFRLDALDHIPPVITVADPLTTVWTTARSYTITGSVSKPGSTVEVFNGESSAGRDELGSEQTQFAIDVDLAADQTHDFFLRATDSLGNVNQQDTFLPSIIQDSTTPTVNVVAPTKNNVLKGGTAFTIKWEANDANFGTDPIDIDWAADGGDWEPVVANHGNSGEYSWQVPDTSFDQAQIRITAEDQVGFTNESASELFSIDADAPTFSALSVDTRTVPECAVERPCIAVSFTEPMSGSVAKDEWKIAGIPAGDARILIGVATSTKVRSILLETQPTQELGKNELPRVSYEPMEEPAASATNRTELHDEAGNTVPDLAKEVDSEDGVAPVVPVIEQIAGQSADDTVTSDDPTPEITVGNLDRGDTAQIFMESDGIEGYSGGDRLVGSSRAAASGAVQNNVNGTSQAVVTTEPLGDPGTYTLYARTLDPGGNLSEGVDSATYRLEGVIVLPTPVIEQIAGRPATEAVTANDPSPDIKVGSIDEGHTAAVYAESDGQGGFTAGDRKLGEQTAGSDGAVVQTSDLGADATYTLYAVARDTEGRRSNADQATYILDTATPAFVAAVTDERHVLVTFEEAVGGLAADAEWHIDGIPSNTTEPAGMASGLTTLELETLPSQTIAPTASPQVTYSPTGGAAANPAPAEFRDVAGNTIEVKTVNAAAKGTQPVPPVPGGKVPPSSGQQPKPGQGAQPVPGTGGTLCQILGTAGNDILLGTDGDDVICGGQGADVIRSGAGNDLILGQEGNDILRGGAGNDDLRGGAGKDSLFGDAGTDVLRGDAGVDRLSGGPGKDRLDGGPSKDRCAGGPGVNRIRRC
jgi:Ca2+-binding RTX toxin-like protein